MRPIGKHALKESHHIIASVAIAALMIAGGAAAYVMARRAIAPAPLGQGHSADVAVNVTASACEPNELTVPAGRVTFSIHNQGSRALEWEILSGVMVVDERENIAPGFIQKLTTKLEPGDYDITCGLLSNPKGKLHVAALGAAVKPSPVDLIGPLAEYRVYASYEIDALVDDTRRFTDAVKSGDLDAARGLYAAAHAHYARIAPIAGLFLDLDGAIDSRAEGFHRLEQGLSANPGAKNLAPVADRLNADVVALQGRFENLAVYPEPTIAGAAEVIGKSASARLAGEADRPEGADLSDLRANVEGVKKIVDLFQPLIEKTDGSLSRALAGDFADIEATLARYANADAAFAPSASLSAADRTALQNATKKLADDLALVRGALGLS